MTRLREFPGFPPGVARPLMTPEGDGSSRIMLCGEALGEWEEKDQLPFRPYAEAGSVLERALYRSGLSRKTLTISNIVWYRPPRNWLDGAPWEFDAIRVCEPLNDELIRARNPRVIVALGGIAFRELTGMAGEKQRISLTRGFIVPGLRYQIPVVGTYHPSFLKRGSKERGQSGPRGKTEAKMGTGGMSLLGVLIRDLQLAQSIAQSGQKEFKYDDYKLGASLSEWLLALDHLRAHPELLVSYDFETQDSLARDSEEEAEHIVREVTQVQISWRPGQALVSPWTPELLPVLREILELPNPKLDWNGRKFDRPILRDLGVRTDLGEWHDGMDLWHHAQPDLPRGLQYAASFFAPEAGPWKNLSASSPLYYGALDVDMPQRIYAGLRLSLGMTRHPVSGESLWGDGQYSGYSGQVVRLAPVLDRMSARGIPVDEDRRSALDVQFSQTLKETFTKLQDLSPREVRGLHVYKKTPYVDSKNCPDCSGSKRCLNATKTKLIKCKLCQGKGYIPGEPSEGLATTVKIGSNGSTSEVPSMWTLTRETVQEKCSCRWGQPKRRTGIETPVPDCPECSNTGKIQVTRELWAKVEPFLPGSPQQVMAYVKWRREEDIKARMARIKNPLTFTMLAAGQEIPIKEMEARRVQAERQTEWIVPLDYKSGRETTSEAELRRLASRTKDPLLPLVLEFREVQKLRGTYVQGWKPSGVTDYETIEHREVRTDDSGAPVGANGSGSNSEPDCERVPNGLSGRIGDQDRDCPVVELPNRNVALVRRIGRVHPSFGFKPATGQLSSENPNAHNMVQHSELAHKMLQMISARPGRRMAKFDWKSFHAVTAGFEAQDADFVRIARVDIHSFFTLVGILKLERPEIAFGWKTDELRDRLSWYRKQEAVYSGFARQKHPSGMTFDEIRDEIAKRCVYGWEFGQMERSLFLLNPESFVSISEAKDFQDELRRLFSKIDKWQLQVCLEADDQKCLVTRYGFVRRFWDVFSRKPIADNYQPRRQDRVYQDRRTGQKWLLSPGDDHESAIAFRPANDAFGMKRAALVKLAELGLDEKFCLISETHDDFRFEFEARLEDELVEEVTKIMEAPSPYLKDPVIAPDGLWCGVECAVGSDWDSLKKVKRG